MRDGGGVVTFTDELDPQAVVQRRRVGAHVAIVALNRPTARNAVSVALTQALDAAVQQVEGDPSVRVAILTGNGAAFCAGADLKEMAAGGAALARSTPNGGFAGFVFAPRRKLWIAAINGPAVAGGFELMLACDMAIATPQAVFGLPEVRRGLAASAGGVFRLPRVLPRGLALEMIATGDSISAQRAEQLGLVNRLVDADRLLPDAIALAERVAGNAPLAVAASLDVARCALDADEAELRRRSQAVIEHILHSDDAREGPRAFAEKRAPRWTGH